MIVYSPQIIENYNLQTGEGLSATFVIIWLAGDFFNLIGAVMAVLQPTVVLLAVYYTVCDHVLFFQVFYYRWKNSQTGVHGRVTMSAQNSESTPLLAQKDAYLSASHWRYTKVLGYIASTMFVLIVGIVAWIMAENPGKGIDEGEQDIIEWKSQLFGYLSASLYLASRVPQIVKNQKTHCAGLSVALFIFSVAGNIAYVASILVKDLGRKHLIANASWLLGSAGTVVLDMIVAGQYFYYTRAREEDALKARRENS